MSSPGLAREGSVSSLGSPKVMSYSTTPNSQVGATQVSQSSTAAFGSIWAEERCSRGVAYWNTCRNRFIASLVGSVCLALILHFIGSGLGGNCSLAFDIAASPFAMGVLIAGILAGVSEYRKRWFAKNVFYFSELYKDYGQIERAEAKYRTDNFKKICKGLVITGIVLAILGAGFFLTANMTWIQQHVFCIVNCQQCSQGAAFGMGVMGLALAFFVGAAFATWKKRIWEKKADEVNLTSIQKLSLSKTSDKSNHHQNNNQAAWKFFGEKNITHTEIGVHLYTILTLFKELDGSEITYDLSELSNLFHNVQLKGVITVSIKEINGKYELSRNEKTITLTLQDIENIKKGNYKDFDHKAIYAILEPKPSLDDA